VAADSNAPAPLLAGREAVGAVHTLAIMPTSAGRRLMSGAYRIRLATHVNAGLLGPRWESDRVGGGPRPEPGTHRGSRAAAAAPGEKSDSLHRVRKQRPARRSAKGCRGTRLSTVVQEAPGPPTGPHGPTRRRPGQASPLCGCGNVAARPGENTNSTKIFIYLRRFFTRRSLTRHRRRCLHGAVRAGLLETFAPSHRAACRRNCAEGTTAPPGSGAERWGTTARDNGTYVPLWTDRTGRRRRRPPPRTSTTTSI